ncbi:MAG: M23 family metallopeptidase [Proteobacteria bacterium]|nr:M23 family metallopeptidase [Pseudomonadota bacterium]
MKEINRRDFLKKTGKIALAGATVFGLESGFLGGSIKLAYGEEPQAGFNVYNDINPNAKDIVAYTFKDCLAQKWWPGICYKTSKPMVAVAGGTVTDVLKPEDSTSHRYENLRNEQNHAKGFCVKVTTGYNYMSFYLHLKKPEIKPLQKVKRGQIIGYPDERWNMPRLVFRGADAYDPNNYGTDHGFMTYWDGSTDLDIGKEKQNKGYEIQEKILYKFADMTEGPKKYTLLRKKHKGMFQYKWSMIEKFRYIEYLQQKKPETFPSLTKDQFEEMRKEFYSHQPIVLTLPFKKG